jgi:predicted phage-related endonuclease
LSLSLEDAARIGGSDMAGILGLSPWSTPLSIYARVVAALEGRALEGAALPYQERGNTLERAVLEVYAQRTGATLLPGPKLVHPDRPFLRASLDARARREGVIVVDAKTVAAGQRHHFGQEGTDQVRQDILFQMTVYIGLGMKTGHITRPAADVPVLGLNGADPMVFTVGWDAELYEMLLAAAERFWVDHVLPRRPPPVTEPLRDADAAGALYPRHSGEAKDWSELATEEQVAVREWLSARQERMEAERAEKAWEARVRLMLATTPSIRCLPPDMSVRRVDWKQNKPSAVTDWRGALEAMRDRGDVSPMQYAEIVKEFTTTKEGARPLKAYALREEEQ